MSGLFTPHVFHLNSLCTEPLPFRVNSLSFLNDEHGVVDVVSSLRCGATGFRHDDTDSTEEQLCDFIVYAGAFKGQIRGKGA